MPKTTRLARLLAFVAILAAAKPAVLTANSLKVQRLQGACLSTPPPPEAEVLFDGTEESTKVWEAGKKGGKLWPVKGGVWVDTACDMRTRKAYGDLQLHLEWRVPKDYRNDGQKGGNSGVIFMDGPGGWYEVQILESHSNSGTYAKGMAGALYNHYAPSSNPSLPKGEWQSYDITFTAPRWDEAGELLSKPKFTVVYNGVTVQKDQELTGSTRRHPDPAKNPIRKHKPRLPFTLQWHNDPVEFRNIWVIDLEKPVKKE
ncbi:MAG: DUF1080 domain-containing protein [Puniceicoccales bacterium]|jgi:hypothetical protein|nr:DUF1080 domain-containing protein [Puniceicoccales bacterium]